MRAAKEQLISGCQSLLALLLLLSMASGSTLLAAANDDFASRITLAGTNITVTGSNDGATKEPGEPYHAGNPGGSSVWWSWTAPTNGDVTVITDGSTNTLGNSLDTLLGVYTGSTVSALSVVASNDDHGVRVTSRVRFQAIKDTQYQIAVDGFNGSNGVNSGSIMLSLVFISEPLVRPANDNFSNRAFLSGSSVATNNSNANATREPGEPYHAGKIGDTSVWWRWTAPTSATVRVSTGGSSFDTLLSVYSGVSLSNLTEVASSDDIDPASGVLTSALAFDTIAGTNYLIAVDGFDGASGQILLRIDEVTTGLSEISLRPDGSFLLIHYGAAVGTYGIYATADFTGWTLLGTSVSTNSTLIFTDPAATNFNRRFYQVLLEP